ncbi:MAG: hypothetical protein Ct9H90mP16_17650 [Candidatus Poseidoniales archaeon]|nr:MAG: hypothetical protein Ct9H90mP16_17650 [Candidatus Poseidoniales archaeon]
MICTTCTRKDGNYYEATMQIRSAGRKLEEDELTELRTSLDTLLSTMEPDPMFFITRERGPLLAVGMYQGEANLWLELGLGT